MQGKTVLITGAGSGLGKAAALTLAAAGANLAILGRTPDELEETATAIAVHGGRVVSLIADIADLAQMQSAFATIKGEFGHLDGVFANAGINGTWAPLDDLTYDEWNETMRINLGGTFLTMNLSVPLMKRQGGSIVITSSINGTRTFTNGGASAYSTTKAGQLALGQMAALELARYGIRVNVICPGAIESEISDNTSKRHVQRATVRANFPDGTVPLTKGEPGTANDVAGLVRFLLSDESRHISGTPIWIDGAQSLLV
ncbi:MAG: SDR family oxidoreductase [Rhizobiaceae bacterium]|nr:MAG: SDR family oxidoreductase [Rhizobiaceae bacterium]